MLVCVATHGCRGTLVSSYEKALEFGLNFHFVRFMVIGLSRWLEERRKADVKSW